MYAMTQIRREPEPTVEVHVSSLTGRKKHCGIARFRSGDNSSRKRHPGILGPPSTQIVIINNHV